MLNLLKKLLKSLKESLHVLPQDKFVLFSSVTKKGREETYRKIIEKCQKIELISINYEKENENPNLADFLDNISLISDIDNYDENEDSISLMTLHSAKGLEFPVVFLVGMEDRNIPKL